MLWEVTERLKQDKTEVSKGIGRESSKPFDVGKGKGILADVSPPLRKKLKAEGKKPLNLPDTGPINLDDLEDSPPKYPSKKVRGKDHPKPQLTKDKSGLKTTPPRNATSGPAIGPLLAREDPEDEEVPLVRCPRKSIIDPASIPAPPRAKIATIPPKAEPSDDKGLFGVTVAPKFDRRHVYKVPASTSKGSRTLLAIKEAPALPTKKAAVLAPLD